MVQLSTSWQKLNEKTVSISGFTGTFSLWAKIVGTQDVTNNRTKVAYDWDLSVDYGWVTSYDAQDYVTGAGWNSATYREYTASGNLRHGEEWISHNADGTGSGSCSGRTRMGGVGVDTDWVSASYTLPTIPRASVPSADPNPLTIGSSGATVTINTNRKSSSFTHDISLSCGTWTDSLTGVGVSADFAIPYSVIAQFADTSKTATCTITCVTKNGSTTIGTKTATLTLQVDTTVDHANIGTITIQDTNARTSAVTQDSTVYISNISTLSASIPLTVSGSYTQLASATVTCGAKTQTYTLSGTSQTITFEYDKVNSSSLSVTVSDKRGNTVTKSESWTLIAYQPVTAVATVGRPSATGSVGVGQVTGMAYGGNFGATQNSLTIVVDFKKRDSATYTGAETFTLALQQDGYNSYSDALTFAYALDYQYQYDIRFTVSDLFSTAVYTAQLMQGLPILSWDEEEVDVWGNLHIHNRSNPTQYWELSYDSDPSGDISALQSMLTMTNYTATGTFTNSNATKTYSVSGKGLVICNVWVRASNADDTGSLEAWVRLLNSSNALIANLAYSGNRLTAASTFQNGANAATAYYFDGESVNNRLQFYVACSKRNTTNWKLQMTAIGCTVEEI